jgi:hypothetical protein
MVSEPFPHLQSHPITLVVMPIGRSKADGSIVAIVIVTRFHAPPKNSAHSTTPIVTPLDRFAADCPRSTKNTAVRELMRYHTPNQDFSVWTRSSTCHRRLPRVVVVSSLRKKNSYSLLESVNLPECLYHTPIRGSTRPHAPPTRRF